MWRYYVLWLGTKLVVVLPTWTSLLIMECWAFMTFHFGRESRAAIEANLRGVLGDGVDPKRLRRVTRQAFRNMCLNYYDLARVPRMSRQEVEKRVVFHGREHLEAARGAGKGVIVASAHLGNLDLVMQAALLISMDIVVLTERLAPVKYHDFVMALRNTQGLTFAEAGASGVKAAFRALKEGRFVGLACDRVIHGPGQETRFFGKPALMPMGAADLALRTGATILPSYSVRAGRDRYDVFFNEPIFVSKDGHNPQEVRALADRVIVVMERYIREYPAQWMAFEPIWDRGASKTSLVDRREKSAAKAA